MAADVSSLVRLMNGYKEDKKAVKESGVGVGGKSTVLITRDLLGGCCTLESKELDLDLQVPSGWEKRLDLKSGKVYLQRCDSPSKHQLNDTVPKLQDLNFPPSSKQPFNFFDDASLDLKLVSSSSSSPPPNYQSVCTLDKVKSALERAERDTIKKRSISISKSSSPLSNSSSSVKEMEMEMVYEEKTSSSFAAGCPSCLLYVLISKNSPKCPRCNTIVPYPSAVKKPRIDLNVSI